MSRLTFWTGALLVGLLAFASAAEASTISQIAIFGDPAVENLISDDSVEAIIKGQGNTGSSLQVGDSVRGIFNINTMTTAFTPLVFVGGNTGNNELTGIFQTLVLAKIATPGAPGEFTYVFGPDPSFAEAGVLGVAASTAGGAGAMALFYEDTTPDFTKINGPDWDYTYGAGYTPSTTDVDSAKDGKYFWALGANGDFFGANGVWDGFTGDDTAVSTLGEAWITSDDTLDPPPATGNIGTAEFSLNRVYGLVYGVGDAWVIDPRQSIHSANQKVEVTGSTEFWGQQTPGGPVPPWPIGDETNFFVNPIKIIPLPAAAWMGLGLMGLLGLGRRLRRRS